MNDTVFISIFKFLYMQKIKESVTDYIKTLYMLHYMENALKKTYWIFSQISFFFYLKVQFFRLIMENNFIQMAASAGHAVAYTIGPIFKHIIDCVQLYFTNGLTNIVL